MDIVPCSIVFLWEVVIPMDQGDTICKVEYLLSQKIACKIHIITLEGLLTFYDKHAHFTFDSRLSKLHTNYFTMANQDPIPEQHFIRASEETHWFKNLKRLGSCKELQNWLRRNPLLLKEMGDGNVSVLDMAVRHGCVELVEDVLNMFHVGGRCKHEGINFTLEDLLRKKNAEGLTAIGIAVMVGSFKIVKLLKGAIESCDKKGMVDEYVHEVKICSPLNYLTWKSMRNTRSLDPNMDDGGNGQMNNFALLATSSSFPTGDHVPPPALPIVDFNFPPIPPPYSITDDSLFESGRDEMDNDEMEIDEMKRDELEVHKIIEEVWDNPIEYMQDIPEHHKIGTFEFPSFKDFIERHTGFTEEHVRQCIDLWIVECEIHPEFEFVSAKEVFIHFLCSVDSIWWGEKDEAKYSHVRFYFIAAVVRECKLQGKLTALFKLHDPQGRTPLHVAIEHWNLDIVEMFWRLMRLMKKNEEVLGGWSDEDGYECWNARDAAGRTPLHAMVVSRFDNAEYLLRVKWVDVDARVCPQHYEDWVALLNWKAPYVMLSQKYKEKEHCTAIHLAVLHNHMNVVGQLISFPSQSKTNHLNDYLRRGLFSQVQDDESLMHEGQYLSAIQLAASMGHINILCLLLNVWIFFVYLNI